MRRRALLAATALPAVAQPVAQPAWPAGRTVTMVVAFPPGGQADVSARPFAAAMERGLGVAVPVVNRAGASGSLGNAFVARSAPDGLTLLMALSSISILPEADRIHGRQPLYELDQLVPIARVTSDPTVIVVPANASWRSLADLVADAKRRPGAISYSSAGNFSTLHTAMAMFTTAADIDMLHAPYQGGGPALTALLGGTVNALASGTGPVLQHILSGRLRALAMTGPERLPALPDVPTMAEAGFPSVLYTIWAGVFVPAATPPALREQIRAAAARAAQDADAARALSAAGSPVAYLDGPAFEAFLRDDAARLIPAVRRIGRVE